MSAVPTAVPGELPLKAMPDPSLGPVLGVQENPQPPEPPVAPTGGEASSSAVAPELPPGDPSAPAYNPNVPAYDPNLAPPYDPNAPPPPSFGGDFGYDPNAMPPYLSPDSAAAPPDAFQQQQWPQMGAPPQEWPQIGAPPPDQYQMLPPPGQPWGGDDYFLDANGFASEPQFDHDAARQRIVQYRKEAAARRRRQMLKAEKQAVAMRAELEKEHELMKQRQEAREAELKAKQAARFARQADERKKRQEEREERSKKSRDTSKSPKRKPLYKVMEEQYLQREAREEAARREVLKSKRQQFEPFDFAEAGRDAEEKMRQARHVAMKKKEEQGGAGAGAGASPLPPVKEMYRSNTHARMAMEMRQEGKAKEATRRKAQLRRDASLRYAKLVSELVNSDGAEAPANPTDRFAGFDSASPVSRTGLTPAAKGGGGAGGLPADASRLPNEPPDMKRLSSRASVLNKQVREKEQVVHALRAAHTDPKLPPPDQLVDSQSELSSLYVDAIKAKLELFESLSATR